MTEPVYADGVVTLFCGDNLEVLDWLEADLLVTDPPYGAGWAGDVSDRDGRRRAARSIVGDEDTGARDRVLELWGDRPAIVFGRLGVPVPAGCRQTLVYRKPPDAGTWGAVGGYRRDLEAVHLCGRWPAGLGGRSSLLTTNARAVGGPAGPAGRTGHPHTKPLDLMETLIINAGLSDMGRVIADPFAGSGSTLLAARNLGYAAVGVEIDPDYCAAAARRLAQGVLEVSL